MNAGQLYPVDYPSNVQFAAHWGEFVKFGYKPTMGSIDVRFDRGFGDRRLDAFSVQFVDGQTKIILMLAVVAFCAELEFGESELENADLQRVLNSFVSIRCSYEHTETQAQQHLRSLRLWSVLFSSALMFWVFVPSLAISCICILVCTANFATLILQLRIGLCDQ